ncbi:hypothetical protein ACHAXM_008150 [Skeletonema potamos]
MEAAWNAFGTDSDSSDSEDDGGAARREKATRLMQQYNTQSAHQDKQASKADDNNSSLISFQLSFDDQKLRTASLPWPNNPPLYLGPAYVEKIKLGGGRGYTAMQNIPPGTCILVEEPLVKGWSEQQVGKRLGLESIQHLFEKDNAQSIVQCMEQLHPTKDKVDSVYQNNSDNIAPLDKIQIVDMISSMDGDTTHSQHVQFLIAYAKEKGVVNSNGTQLNSRDINRLLLTMRYNGFDSGLYLHFSIFNHDEDPNCIKFRPSTEGTQQRPYSEARKTRHVKKGEALTLHYLENPREVSHATRRKILWDQHRFDIGDEEAFKKFLRLAEDSSAIKQAVYQSELVHGSFPESDKTGAKEGSDGDLPAACNIENSLDDLEDMVVELQAILESKPDEGKFMSSASFERAAALELTAWELITASEASLGNNHHILLSRCRRLHLDSIEILLEYCSSILDNKASTELMARFLPSALELLESQKLRLGNDHTDVARTSNDISMGIQALLSHSPKRLLSLELEGMRTLDQCSRMEHFFRKEKERIEKLFPKDADNIIAMVKEAYSNN